MKLSFFLLIGLISFQCLGQSSYEAGYIILQNRDTVNGFILEAPDGQLARKIKFKTNKNASASIYRSKELVGFGFNNGRVFERFPIVSSEGDTAYVFAKNVIRGKIDAYVWRHPNRSKPDFFLINNSTNNTVQLTKPAKKVIKDKNGKSYFRKDYRYAGNLMLIKEDTVLSKMSVPPVRYTENKIKEDIIAYNQDFTEEYILKEYEEQIKFNYDIIGGMPINSAKELHFRAGIYRNKSRVERSTNFSVIQGIVYHHWSNDNREIPASGRGFLNYRWQLLNIIPWGVNFHGNSKVVQPYGYAGLGVAALKMTNDLYSNGEANGNEKLYYFFPTLNFGVGTKIRLGNNFLITELTPTINGLFWNVGFSL